MRHHDTKLFAVHVRRLQKAQEILRGLEEFGVRVIILVGT